MLLSGLSSVAKNQSQVLNRCFTVLFNINAIDLEVNVSFCEFRTEQGGKSRTIIKINPSEKYDTLFFLNIKQYIPRKQLMLTKDCRIFIPFNQRKKTQNTRVKKIVNPSNLMVTLKFFLLISTKRDFDFVFLERDSTMKRKCDHLLAHLKTMHSKCN